MKHDQSRPTISHIFADGRLIDLVFDAEQGRTLLALGSEDVTQPTLVEEVLAPDGVRMVPYSPQNSLLTSRCVLLPSEVGGVISTAALASKMRAFLHTYVDLSPEFEVIAAYYVLLTWVFDRFNDIPYLRLRGDYGSGKTRALLAIGSLCYKPFFASGASTVSPIFHIQDAFQGTLVLDEADFRFSDATAELSKVLNNGTTRGLPVLRTMSNRNRELHPTAFRVFGPKIIAMREGFTDAALESRFITEETGGRPLRADIPIHLPASFEAEALELRNLLLGWRLRNWKSIDPDLTRVPADLRPRSKQMGLALLSIIDDVGVREALCTRLREQDAQQATRHRTSPDVVLLRCARDAFAQRDMRAVTVAELTARFNAAMAHHMSAPVTTKWVGCRFRSLTGISTTKSGGVYVIPRTEEATLASILKCRGISNLTDADNATSGAV
jgi:hypothetical protein